MNRNDTTARADAPTLTSAFAPNATPMPSGAPTGEIDASCAADGINAIS